jgi:hypothetical protein
MKRSECNALFQSLDGLRSNHRVLTQLGTAVNKSMPYGIGMRSAAVPCGFEGPSKRSFVIRNRKRLFVLVLLRTMPEPKLSMGAADLLRFSLADEGSLPPAYAV